MRKVVAVVVGIVLAVAVVACGGDDDDGAVDESGTTTTEAPDDAPAQDDTRDEGDAPDEEGGDAPGGDAPGGDGDCPFLPSAAVRDVLGPGMGLLAAADAGCAFADDAGTSLQVTLIPVQIDPGEYADQAVEGCDEGSVVEVDAGDRAYACTTGIGPHASLFDGTDLVTLSLSGHDDGDEAAVVDQLAALLPSATAG